MEWTPRRFEGLPARWSGVRDVVLFATAEPATVEGSASEPDPPHLVPSMGSLTSRTTLNRMMVKPCGGRAVAL